MVSRYKNLATSLLDAFPNTPLIGTGEAVDILKGYSTETSHASYLTQVNTTNQTIWHFRHQRPKILFTMAVRPYTEAELPALGRSVARNMGDYLGLTELNLCSPTLLDVLRLIEDNSRVYSDVQNLGLRDMVTELRYRKMQLINEQLKSVGRSLVRTDEGYVFIPDISANITHTQTIDIAQDNHAALGGEVEPVAKLCKVAYLPEDVEESRAEKQAVDMLVKTGKEHVRGEHFYVFRMLARSIGYGKAEDALGRRVKGMWDPSISPAQLDELHAFLKTDNILYEVVRELQTSFKPQIMT